MYKMLIAEQDQEQIEVLRTYTEKSLNMIEIINVEKNGILVLDFLEKEWVDIAVLAVNLEGISGLEVARRIQEQHREIHIIMISAYDYLDFFKEAMNLGVKDYLIKPVNLSEYARVVMDKVKELDKNKKEKNVQNELERREDRINIFTDYSFIYTFLWNEKSSHLLKTYQEILGIDKYGYIMNIEFTRVGEECVIDGDKDFTIIAQGIKDILGNETICVVGPKIGKRIIIYISQSNKEYRDNTSKTSALLLANRLRSEMKRCFDIEVRLGIGSVRKISAIHNSYEESIKSLRYKETSNIIHISDVVANSVPHRSYMELEKKFLQNAKFGREECLEQFRAIWEVLQPLNNHDKKNKVLELLILLCREVRIQRESEVNSLDYMEFASQIAQLNEFELKDWAYKHVEYIIKSVRAKEGPRKSIAVKEAILYINEHYKEDLSLAVISEYVGVTPQHFSKIFKAETESKYVDWVTKVRIDKAKEYLLEGTMNIREIGEAVGIHDANYFSRKFKEVVGKTPTAFARR